MAKQVEIEELDLSEVQKVSKNSGVRFCAYCGLGYSNIGTVKITDAIGVKTLLHRNCVVAFATRILNEFEKL